MFFQRWFDNPRELTRQLLKELVGIDNLIHMYARGNSKRGKKRTRKGIPEDIVTCVECKKPRKFFGTLTKKLAVNFFFFLIFRLRQQKVYEKIETCGIHVRNQLHDRNFASSQIIVF